MRRLRLHITTLARQHVAEIVEALRYASRVGGVLRTIDREGFAHETFGLDITTLCGDGGRERRQRTRDMRVPRRQLSTTPGQNVTVERLRCLVLAKLLQHLCQRLPNADVVRLSAANGLVGNRERLLE